MVHEIVWSNPHREQDNKKKQGREGEENNSFLGRTRLTAVNPRFWVDYESTLLSVVSCTKQQLLHMIAFVLRVS